MYLICFYTFTFLSITITLFLARWDLKRRSPFLLLWIVILFLVLLPSLLDPFNRTITPHQFASTLFITDESLIYYSFYTFLILLSLLILYIVFNSAFKIKSTVYLKSTLIYQDNKSIFYLLFLCSGLIGFYEFYQAYGLNIFVSLDFTTRRETSSLLSNFLLSYPFMICAGLGCYYFVNKKYTNFLIVFSLYLFLYFVFGGSRQPIIAFILPFIAYYCIGEEKFNKKISVIITIASFFSGFILNALIYFRNLSSFTQRLEALNNPIELINNISNREGAEENVRYAYYYFLQNSDYQNGYFGFEYFLRTLLFWLPSPLDFFEIKPQDFEYKMFADFMNGEQGTMHPTIFGSIYADSGWLFLPWVMLLGIFLYFLPIYLQKFKGITYFCIWSTCFFYSFMLARGSIYGSIVVIASAILFGLLIQKFNYKLGLK